MSGFTSGVHVVDVEDDPGFKQFAKAVDAAAGLLASVGPLTLWALTSDSEMAATFRQGADKLDLDNPDGTPQGHMFNTGLNAMSSVLVSALAAAVSDDEPTLSGEMLVNGALATLTVAANTVLHNVSDSVLDEVLDKAADFTAMAEDAERLEAENEAAYKKWGKRL